MSDNPIKSFAHAFLAGLLCVCNVAAAACLLEGPAGVSRFGRYFMGVICLTQAYVFWTALWASSVDT